MPYQPTIYPRLEVRDVHNVFRRDITPLVQKGTMSANENNQIKRTFSCDLLMPDDGSQPAKSYSDYLAPFLTVVFEDGSTITSQCGLYRVTPASTNTHTPGVSTVTLDCHDVTTLLDNAALAGGRYTVLAGTRYTDRIVQIIEGTGISRYDVPPSTQMLTQSRTWPINTSMLDIANDLCTTIGYYTLWTDPTGMVRTAPYRRLATLGASRAYTCDPDSQILAETGITDSANLDRLTNQAVVMKEDSTDDVADPIVSIRLNTDPRSPISITNIGELKLITVTDSNIADQAAADARADKIIEEAAAFSRTLTVEVFHDPRADLHETVDLTLVNRFGNPVATGRWWMPSWEMGFTTDERMTMTLARDEAWA